VVFAIFNTTAIPAGARNWKLEYERMFLAMEIRPFTREHAALTAVAEKIRDAGFSFPGQFRFLHGPFFGRDAVCSFI